MRVYLDVCCFNRPFDEQVSAVICLEPFDYTKWRQNLYKDMPLDEFLKNADEHRSMAEA
ncbi:MAG: hypothetical protein FWG42_03445 [Clostridiales bacterium]|nr:hypothetical protein [Clostridiales bacterium]